MNANEAAASTIPAAVLFDMDGTLVDTERHWLTAVTEVAATLGRPLTAPDEPHVTGRPTRYTAEYLATPGSSDPVEIGERLVARFSELVRADATPLPGVPELLGALADRGVPTAIISASPRSVVEMVREVLGRDLFVTVVGEEDTDESKPAPDPYVVGAARLGVHPRDCVAVEDSVVGRAAALAAGCRVVVVTGDDNVAEAPGLLVRRSMLEVNVDMLAAHAGAVGASE